MSKINFYLLEYALGALKREKYKSLFIVIVLTTLSMLLSSVFFITNSLKYELNTTLDTLPQIVVQNTEAGRVVNINASYGEKILELQGVENVIPRVWGYYKFDRAGVYFTLVGVDEFEENYTKLLESINQSQKLDSSNMIVGEGVKKILDQNYYKEYFNFIQPDGSIKKVDIAGTFNSATNLESNDMIVMQKELLREIFGMQEGMATDLVVKVNNLDEVSTIAAKIKLLLPNAKVTTHDDIKLSYEHLFNYKSGLFLALFVIAIFTFFIIIYDKMSGLSSESKREIGILKAIGWKIDDILKEKFYEAMIIALFSYFLGVVLALFYVYIFNAPLLSSIFFGYSDLKPALDLVFVFDFQTLFLVFFLSVPIYVAATIIPAWRVSVLDADEVMR